MTLRAYQVDGIERVRTSLRSGRRRVLFVMATGGGKTIVASSIIASAIALGSRVLFIAHRRELIRQPFCKLVRGGIPYDKIGIIMAGCESSCVGLLEPQNDDELYEYRARRRPTAPVQIASIQTLQNRQLPPADLIIIDEAHRALAPSYRKLFDFYQTAVHLGLTATPFGPNDKTLGDVYEDLIVIASPRQLIDEGFLVEPSVFTVPAAELPDLAGVRVKGGDYDEKALAVAVDTQGLVGNIVDHWIRRADGRRTVGFCVNVAHSKHLAERFVAAGVPAEHLDGETDHDTRDAILRRLESGETRVVTNCDVLTEGWDQPCVKCCILARPTRSLRIYLQQAGRILRPWNGVEALILDHAGCALEHLLPQADREYSLEAKPKRRGAASTTTTKACQECYAVLPSQTRVCPKCGFVFNQVDSVAVPEETPGELVQVREVSFHERKEYWDQLCHATIESGKKPGFAYYRYKEKYGTKPPFRFPLDRMNEDQKRAEFARIVQWCRDNGRTTAMAFGLFRKRFGVSAQRNWLPPEPQKEIVPWAV